MCEKHFVEHYFILVSQEFGQVHTTMNWTTDILIFKYNYGIHIYPWL
jgi:hypothetical protein